MSAPVYQLQLQPEMVLSSLKKISLRSNERGSLLFMPEKTQASRVISLLELGYHKKVNKRGSPLSGRRGGKLERVGRRGGGGGKG